MQHDDVLVAAHGNSLRGIIKVLKGISDEDIVELNLPTAVPYVFEFDDELRLVKDYFLGDPEEIKKLMEAVANQGKKLKPTTPHYLLDKSAPDSTCYLRLPIYRYIADYKPLSLHIELPLLPVGRDFSLRHRITH